MDDQAQLLARVEEILRPYYARISDQNRVQEVDTIRGSSAELVAAAEHLRIEARVWAAQALMEVLTNHNVVPLEPGAFSVLQDRLVQSLAADAAEFFSLCGILGAPNYHDEIRAWALADLPKIAERPRSVNRRRYLGDTSLPDDVPSRTPDLVRPRRTPDLDTSRRRLKLVDTLVSELAALKQDLKRYCTADGLKRKYPKFTLWTLIEDSRLKELVDGEEFTPRALAENLTLSKFGLTSRETLRKDRKKIRQAQKPKRP